MLSSKIMSMHPLLVGFFVCVVSLLLFACWLYGRFHPPPQAAWPVTPAQALETQLVCTRVGAVVPVQASFFYITSKAGQAGMLRVGKAVPVVQSANDNGDSCEVW